MADIGGTLPHRDSHCPLALLEYAEVSTCPRRSLTSKTKQPSLWNELAHHDAIGYIRRACACGGLPPDGLFGYVEARRG